MLPLLVLIWLVPLFLYLHKVPGQGFVLATARLGFWHDFWVDKLLSFPVWLVVVSVVELAGVPLFLALAWKRLRNKERAYFIGAFLFFVSTYAIAFSVGNNYSMRGLLVPSIVLCLLFARRYETVMSALRPRFGRAGLTAVAIVAVLFSFGNVLEFAGHARRSLLSMELTWRIVKGNEAAEKKFPIDYRDIARNRSLGVYEPRPGEPPRLYFNAEKRVEVPLAEMEGWERALLRYPRTGWFF